MVTVIKKNIKKKDAEKLLNNLKPTKSEKLFTASKFCGKIKFSEDALKIQKQLRNEWLLIN